MSSTPTPTPDTDLPPLSDYFTSSSIRLVTPIPIESFLEGHITELFLPDIYATFSSSATNHDAPSSSKVGVFLGMLLCKWDNCVGPHIEHFWRAHIPDIVIYPVPANLNGQSAADDLVLDGTGARLSVSTLVDAETRAESANADDRRDTLKSEFARAFACAHDPTFLKRVATVSLTSHVENTPHEPPLERLLEKYPSLNAAWMSRSGRGRAPSIKSFHFPERRVSLASFIFHSGPPAQTASVGAGPPPDSSSSLYSLSVLYHTILPRPLSAPLFSQNGRHNPGASQYEFHVFIQSLLESVFTWQLPCIAISEPKMERAVLLDYFGHVACTVAQLLNSLARYNLFDSTLACVSPSLSASALAAAAESQPLTGDQLEDAVADASLDVARTLLERSAFVLGSAFATSTRALHEFLARAIAAHLATSGRTLVIGRDRAQVEALVNALALFLTPDELRTSCILPAPPSYSHPPHVKASTAGAAAPEHMNRRPMAAAASVSVSASASAPTSASATTPLAFTELGISKFFDWRAFCTLVGIVQPEEAAHNHASLWSAPGAQLDAVALSSYVYSSHLPLAIINVDQRTVQHSVLTPQFQRRRINLLGLIERVLLSSSSADFAAPPPTPAPAPTPTSPPAAPFPVSASAQAGAQEKEKGREKEGLLNFVPFAGPSSGVPFLHLPASAAHAAASSSAVLANAQSDAYDASPISAASSWDGRWASLLKLAVSQDRSVGMLLFHVKEPNRIVSGFLEQLLDILSVRAASPDGASDVASAASSGDSSLVSSISSSSLPPLVQRLSSDGTSSAAQEDTLINALEWIDMFRVDLEARARLLQELLSTRDEMLCQFSKEKSSSNSSSSGASRRANANALHEVSAREQLPGVGVGSSPSASTAAATELLQRSLCIESEFELALVCATLARVPDGLHALTGCAV